MSDALAKANRIAGDVYSRFMKQVIEKHVLNDRCGQRVYVKAKPKIKTKAKTTTAPKETDIRTLYLLSISGKGGWTDNPKKQASYLKNANITLLDHLLSVTRGALMLAAMDLLLSNKQMDMTLLERRLKVIVVIAFLHDLDKMERLKRDQALPLELVEQALIHYGLYDFIADEPALSLDAEQVRYLIEHAEDSQAHRHQPAILPERIYENDIKNYVKLADKLDGIWQQYGAEGGLKQVIQRLQKEQSLQVDLLSQWQRVELYDPHHPFLLDELQKYLSSVCKRRAKIPPLIEVHQDGRLFMLLPTHKAEAIKQEGLQRFCRRLPFALYLNISTVGVPELINEKPDYAQYKTFIDNLDSRNLSKIFTVKCFLVESITAYMDEALGVMGLKPQWPKIIGQTITPYPDPDGLKQNERTAIQLNKAASLALLLNLKMPNNKKVLNYARREAQLLALISDLSTQPIPHWISTIEEKARQSRCTLLALWVTALSVTSVDIEQAIWGDEGLLKTWLEGDETQLGFCAFIEDKGAHIVHAVEQHFQQLMAGEYQAGEKGTGHCIFTDKPTKTLITGSMKLHGVKVSAFAGRDGRSETVVASPKGRVHISEVSIAEYKLREEAFTQQGGKPSGVPSLISSPVTTGLFSALILNNEAALQGLSIYDLARKKIVKGKVTYRGLEVYRSRYRMARFEVMPTKLVDQINTLRLLLSACLRIGRPIHVFRGLPTYQKAFFYYDAMPPVLQQLLGFHQLRIEQIPTAIEQLKIADELINENGLGHDVFKRYANPKTRLKAVCLAWCHLHDRKNLSGQLSIYLLTDYFNLPKEKIMNEDVALVRFGQAAAKIQRYANNRKSKELLIFTIALNTTLGLRAIQQSATETLILGIAGELETNLNRKGDSAYIKNWSPDTLKNECISISEQFVHEVWDGVLKKRPPSQRSRRLLSSVYRMAFIQAQKTNFIETKK